MKALTKLTVATLAVAAIGAVAVHTIEAHVISPVSALHQDGASDSKTYADWQGPLGQSFGARFLAQGAPRDAIAGGVPGHGLTLPIFQGLENMQVVPTSSAAVLRLGATGVCGGVASPISCHVRPAVNGATGTAAR